MILSFQNIANEWQLATIAARLFASVRLSSYFRWPGNNVAMVEYVVQILPVVVEVVVVCCCRCCISAGTHQKSFYNFIS